MIAYLIEGGEAYLRCISLTIIFWGDPLVWLNPPQKTGVFHTSIHDHLFDETRDGVHRLGISEKSASAVLWEMFGLSKNPMKTTKLRWWSHLHSGIFYRFYRLYCGKWPLISLKLAVCNQKKWMVGRQSFPFGMAHFRGQTVSFRHCNLRCPAGSDRTVTMVSKLVYFS